MHYIMNKNIPIMEIETGKILSDINLLPYSLRIPNLSLSSVQDWLRDRALQANRANSEELYDELGVAFNDKVQLVYKTYGTSLNDNYWVKEDTDTVIYADVSIFRNDLSKRVYEIALKGSSEISRDSKVSAEYTGQGSYAKCFVKEENGIYMYKSDRDKNLEYEVIAGNMAKVLNMKTATYELSEIYGVKCTKSKIISDETVNWETALSLSEYFGKTEYKIPQDFALQQLTAEYCNMAIFDAIVLNDDRHMKNWAFEFNADNNDLIGLAPSYDYNNTFIGDKNTMSLLLFNGQRHVNILTAARMAYRDYYTTLDFNNLINYISSYDLQINKQALTNRLLYITGQKSNQNDCY